MKADRFSVALPLVLPVALVVSACGAGPTDGPRGPEPLVVGGVLGDAGVTMASPTEGSGGAGRGRSRNATAANDQRRGGDDDRTTAVADVPADPGPDPMGGQFSLAQATAGFPATGPLVAVIKTSKGEMKCRLFDDKAPIAVANFVGLARGTRPYRDPAKGRWVTKAAYDGTTFHRVIHGFMVQGGDPQGTGRGEPGYTFKDELWQGNGSKHDRPGLLCMANRGPDTNGMQFFITDAAAAHLDKSYTIFGECAPVSVVHAIANVPTDSSDRPEKDITIDKVEITRGGKADPGAPVAAEAGVAKDAKDGGAAVAPKDTKDAGAAPTGSAKDAKDAGRP